MKLNISINRNKPSWEKNLYIDASHPDETRVVLKSNDHIEEYEYENKNKLNLKNNIYLGKISRIEPSLQAAFVNYGKQRHGFLAFNDVQSDYYQIPHDDKEKLKKEEEGLRQELKEVSNTIDETQKPLNQDDDLSKTNGNLQTVDKEKNENPIAERNSHFNSLKKKYGIRRYRIQEVLKPDQIVLIQILKDERGQKGAALTTFISLAGKYSVLMPNTSKGGGISRKIVNPDDRKKIRTILQQIEIPKSMGVIVRTAGLNKTKNDLDKDIISTISVWENIKEKAMLSIAPSLVYEEGDLIKRSLRDMNDNETKNIIIEGNEGFQKAKNYSKLLMPESLKKIKKYRGKIPMFHDTGIEKELNKIFDSVVKLTSGGYLVINPTEALVSIDINSGQSIKEVNIEKTALKTNLEAADEIARQIKIRDLSGLIVIDFIDMLNFHNRKSVERTLREKLKDDRARIQFGRIGNFGLLEMTRQRLRQASINWETVLSLESFSQKIIKKIELLAFTNKVKIIKAFIPEKVKLYIEGTLSKEIDYFQKKFLFKINFLSDSKLIIPEYKIELLNKSKKIIDVFENVNKINATLKKNNNNELKKTSSNEIKTNLKKSKKIKVTKKKKKLRTLWVRRKKSV